MTPNFKMLGNLGLLDYCKDYYAIIKVLVNFSSIYWSYVSNCGAEETFNGIPDGEDGGTRLEDDVPNIVNSSSIISRLCAAN
jgi:hypothetical protein